VAVHADQQRRGRPQEDESAVRGTKIGDGYTSRILSLPVTTPTLRASGEGQGIGGDGDASGCKAMREAELGETAQIVYHLTCKGSQEWTGGDHSRVECVV
jgi:hypothetical protein